MGKLLKVKIDVNKIDPDRLFAGEKGNWLDLDIWLNDEPDKYGNDASVQQHTKKDENKIYIGSGKYFVSKDTSDPVAKPEWMGKKTTTAMSDVNELPGANTPKTDDLPW